jgi:hypothetical protein
MTMRSVATVAVGLFVLFTLARADQENKEAASKEGKKVELTGTLRTGIVAAGGETTGTIIETKKGNFELDFGKQKELRDKAEKLAGKTVLVAGTSEIRQGVEVKERKLVSVTSLKEAKDK